MSTPSENSQRWVVDEMVDKERLKQLAIELEQQLRLDSALSKDVAAFAEYPPLVSAIRRAKDMMIDAAEELPGMRYWLFETELADARFNKLGDTLGSFRKVLRCWRLFEA